MKTKNSIKKIITCIVIIIAIILLLITGCNSDFFGRIGELFIGSSHHVIDSDDSDKEIILNKYLKFDTGYAEITLDDKAFKLSYSYENISPSKFTCTTSNADVATCVAHDGYVEVNPKNVGEVTIYIETETNGKVYRGSSLIKVGKSSKYISLSSKKGTINLNQTNKLKVFYTLVDIKGDVEVKVEDESIASVKAKDGVVDITALKVGSTKITLSVKYNVKTFNSTFNLNVIDKKITTTTTGNKKPNTTKKTSTTKIPITSGTTSTTKPVVNPELYLLDIKLDNGTLTPTFNKDILEYDVRVKYDVKNISVSLVKDKSITNLVYKFNGIIVDSLNNLPLNTGDNTLDIILVGNTRSSKSYKINIYRNIRTVELDKNNYEFKIEEKPFNISYNVYEENNEIDNYDLKDIKILLENYNGTYKLEKGYIVLDPSIDDIGRDIKLNISYDDKVDTANIKFKTNEYYFNTYSDKYDVTINNGNGYKNIIFNTNIFNDYEVINIDNGIRIKEKGFSNAYVDIASSDTSIVKVEFGENQTGNTSYKVKAVALKGGEATLTVTSSIFNKVISTKVITLNVIEKYNIEINANCGFFNEFTSVYKFLLNKNEKINLSEYVSYKVDTTGNCMYYELIEYNSLSDGSGDKYSKNQVLTNFDKDLTLYSIYSSESKYIELESTSRLYLTEVDIFHNEEYYELYNKDKVIYPGATGSYIMTIENNTGSTIKLKQLNLEEDTICIDNNKCINMGYVIKYSGKSDKKYTYYYGDKDNYKVLYKDNNTKMINGTETGYHTENNIELDPVIEIPDGETIEISLLWQWVDSDDKLDTDIGDYVNNNDNKYTLTVSIDFEKTNTYCDLD